jgi:hypothetical protein
MIHLSVFVKEGITLTEFMIGKPRERLEVKGDRSGSQQSVVNVCPKSMQESERPIWQPIDIREHLEHLLALTEEKKVIEKIWLSICLGDMSNGPTSPNTLCWNEARAIYRTRSRFKRTATNEQTDHLDVWDRY